MSGKAQRRALRRQAKYEIESEGNGIYKVWDAKTPSFGEDVPDDYNYGFFYGSRRECERYARLAGRRDGQYDREQEGGLHMMTRFDFWHFDLLSKRNNPRR